MSREHLWWLPVGLAAPIFTLLAGVSYYSWLTMQRDKGIDDCTISKRTVRRGLFLFGLGFAFNVFIWLPEDTFNWDILTFIGSALIFLNLIRKIPTEVLIFGILLVMILSLLFRLISDYYAFWINGYFEHDFSLRRTSWIRCNWIFPTLPLAHFSGYRLCHPSTFPSQPQ